MQISTLARKLLQLVFALSSASTALTRPRLERRLGVNSAELKLALDELTGQGLLDPQRLRLTLSGLAIAIACGARSQAEPRAARAAARRAPRMTAIQPPIALFSQREAPRAVA